MRKLIVSVIKEHNPSWYKIKVALDTFWGDEDEGRLSVVSRTGVEGVLGVLATSMSLEELDPDLNDGELTSTCEFEEDTFVTAI